MTDTLTEATEADEQSPTAHSLIWEAWEFDTRQNPDSVWLSANVTNPTAVRFSRDSAWSAQAAITWPTVRVDSIRLCWSRRMRLPRGVVISCQPSEPELAHAGPCLGRDHRRQRIYQGIGNRISSRIATVWTGRSSNARRTMGTMAKTTSFSLSETVLDLIGTAAERDGLSKSAWMERAAVYYALVKGAPADQNSSEAHAEALADERDAAAADDEFHERGAA